MSLITNNRDSVVYLSHTKSDLETDQACRSDYSPTMHWTDPIVCKYTYDVIFHIFSMAYTVLYLWTIMNV